MLSIAAASRRVIASSAGPTSMTCPRARRLPSGSSGSPRAASATCDPAGTARISASTSSAPLRAGAPSSTRTDGPSSTSNVPAASSAADRSAASSGSAHTNGRPSRSDHWHSSVVLP